MKKMNLQEYFKQYDELMSEVYSEEANRIAAEESEDELRADLMEEYMWYKCEDYMLWKTRHKM